jgi:phage terminase large subunit-like protein
VPLREWADQGFLTLTEGNTIDYDVVETDIVADADHFDLQTVGFDRMFAGQMVQEVAEELKGVEVTPVAQTYLGQSPSIKELWRLLGKTEQGQVPGRIRHAGDPVSRWMASVVETTSDGMDNYRLVKPNRGKSQARIDGIAAMTTGLDGYVRRRRIAESYAYSA